MPECKKVFDFVKNVKVIEDTNQRSKEKINLNAKVYDLEKQKRLLESRLKNILTNFNLSNIQIHHELKEKSLKNTFSSAFENSTIHGISKLLNQSHLYMKLVWSLCILISISGCAYLIIQSFEQFYRYDVITQTKVINQNQVIFPAVTICNHLYPEFQLKNLLFRCFYKDYSNSKKDESNCYSYDFEPIRVHDENGVVHHCYRYNAGINFFGQQIPLQTTNKVGFAHGVHFYFYLAFNDFLRVYIGDKSYKPLYSEVNRLLDSNYTSSLVINKLVDKKLEEPYNPCKTNWHFKFNPFLNDSIIDEYNGEFNGYRQNNCYELCNQIHSSIEKCKENCPLECETISYSTDFISITYNPSQERFDKNKASIATQNNISNLSDSELKSRMLSFYIYFEHLKFTEITQIPKTTVSDLISAIGGSLSLFLGISLLSFIEILEFLYEAYYTC